MSRALLMILLFAGLLLAGPAHARVMGPPQVASTGKDRDLAQIRASRELRVLVNQSRNSSGEVKGQPYGVEYYLSLIHI